MNIRTIVTTLKSLVVINFFITMAIGHSLATASTVVTPPGWIETKPFSPVVFAAARISGDQDVQLNSHVSVQVYSKIEKHKIFIRNLQGKKSVDQHCWQIDVKDSTARQTWCEGSNKVAVIVESGPAFWGATDFQKLLEIARRAIK